MDSYHNLADKLKLLYGDDIGNKTADRLISKLEKETKNNKIKPLDQSTSILITYGDSIKDGQMPPLRCLHEFLSEFLQDSISHVHILPFYPYSSDDGFSILDYRKVDSALGGWTDIENLQKDFGTMYDFVLNHMSAQSSWFQSYLNDDSDFRDFFIEVDKSADTSSVRRPRTSPLVTSFHTKAGKTKDVWTTFSSDQVDLNYSNPEVLLAMIDILLFYVRHGAEFVRLDAATYLWKKLGTESASLRETHLLVQTIHDVLSIVAPGVRIITETNVEHSENMSYLADGYSEAQGVYNFALPPLLVHTIQSGDKTVFESWAKSLEVPGDKTFLFNFTASHDGIGLMPVQNLLTQDQIYTMVENVKNNGGLVSYKSTPDGQEEPYELNTTYYDALYAPDDRRGVMNKKFILSQSIMLSLKGVPGIYIGSLIGNRNWLDGVAKTDNNRTINRQKIILNQTFDINELDDSSTDHGYIFNLYKKLLSIRSSEPCFSPTAGMEIINLHSSVIAIKRYINNSHILTLHNISASPINIELNQPYLNNLNSKIVKNNITLNPHDIAWLKSV